MHGGTLQPPKRSKNRAINRKMARNSSHPFLHAPLALATPASDGMLKPKAGAVSVQNCEGSGLHALLQIQEDLIETFDANEAHSRELVVEDDINRHRHDQDKRQRVNPIANPAHSHAVSGEQRTG